MTEVETTVCICISVALAVLYLVLTILKFSPKQLKYKKTLHFLGGIVAFLGAVNFVYQLGRSYSVFLLMAAVFCFALMLADFICATWLKRASDG